jgi:MFS family permease
MRGRYAIYGLLFLVSVVTYFDRVVLSLTLPALSRDFGLGVIEQGYLLSAFLWIYVCLLVPAGVVLDWMGTRRLVATAMTFWSLMTIASGATFNFASMLVTRILLGVGEAPAYPACVRAVREWAPLRERAFATSVFGAGANFGTAVSTVAITWVITVAGWRMAFVVSGASGLVLVVVWLIFYHDPRTAHWLGREEFQLARYRAMWALVIVMGCINYTNYLTLSWLPTYLVRSRGLDLMHSGYDFAIINIGACLFTLLFGRLSDAALTPEAAWRGGLHHGQRRAAGSANQYAMAARLGTDSVCNRGSERTDKQLCTDQRSAEAGWRHWKGHWFPDPGGQYFWHRSAYRHRLPTVHDRQLR